MLGRRLLAGGRANVNLVASVNLVANMNLVANVNLVASVNLVANVNLVAVPATARRAARPAPPGTLLPHRERSRRAVVPRGPLRQAT